MNERFVRAAISARVDLAHERDFVLGHVEIRPARREIVGEGLRETIEPRVMRVLVALTRAKGEILSRDDLIESCWEGVIVGEDAINRCISQLRKAADASGNAFSIETVPRVGYRLKVADAVPWDEEPDAVPPTNSVPAAAAPPSAAPKPSLWPVRAKWAAAAIAVLALVATGIGLWKFRPGPAEIPTAPIEASVAVLPFVNMSGDPRKEYFSDGFAEELLNDLSNNPRLLVAARTSAFAFKGRNEDIRAIARALQVRAVVEGSVREAGNRVRITAQLINGRDGYHLWSAIYDRNLVDVLSVQNEVARAITAALARKLLRSAPAVPHVRIDPEAYRLYLQARQQLDEYSWGGYGKALSLFKQVTIKQPNFVGGYAGLARAALNFSEVDPTHSDSDLVIAKLAAQKALSLDPGNIEAREVRFGTELHAWNWAAAATDILALRRESPNNFRVLAGLRIFFNTMGFPGEAIGVAERARSLDPLSNLPNLVGVGDLVDAGRYRDAVGAARAVLVHEPGNPTALLALCEGYAHTGRTDDARGVEERIRRLNTDGASQLESQICDFEIDITSGRLEEARTIIKDWEAKFPDEFVYARDIAGSYVELHDFDRASDWYERAYERREPRFFASVYWPVGAEYRKTARWKALTQQPLFKEWQAEHDRVGAALVAHRDAR